jgi:acetoacetyl-CoA synthetase
VRFGSAELYYILEKEFKHDVIDSLAVGQKLKNGDERVLLFVVTPDGKPLKQDLIKNISATIAQRLSRRHVPAVMEASPGVPVTLSGKKLESSVKKIV